MARLPRSSRARGTVFVVTLVVVVAGVVGVPAVIGPGPGDHPEYAVDALVPERAESTGEPAVDRREERGVVLIDDGHFNRYDPAEIQPLLAAITAAGYEVDLLEVNENLDRELSSADAFVVIDPGRRYTETEAARVERFVERGGRLVLLGEPTQATVTGFGVTTVTSRMHPLSSRFGLEFGSAHLYNMAENDGNHLNVFAEPDGASVVGSGLSRTAFYTATTVHAREGRAVLVAGEGARSARTDATGRYPVAATNGNVLAIGDSTFVKRANYRVVDNERLVANVVRFLVEGEKQRALWDYPAGVSPNPTVHYTGPALLPAAQSASTTLREAGYRPTATLNRRPGPEGTDVLVTTYAFLADHGGLETGVRATGDRVRVGRYESNARGIIVVRAPASGYDLVIAADTPQRARQAAEMLDGGAILEHVVDDRTAIVRTSDAVRLVGSDNSTTG